MARSFIKSTDLDYNAAGFVARNLNGWQLAHSSLESWKQFYHVPYKNDWAEATQKAIERKLKEEGKDFTTAYDCTITASASTKKTKEITGIKIKDRNENH